MYNNCGGCGRQNTCGGGSCNHCHTACDPCIDCFPATNVIVKPLRKKDNCDTLIETIKELTKPINGGCSLKLKGTIHGSTVVLVASQLDVTYSSDGINFGPSSAFASQASGQRVYFAKDRGGCLASITLSINANCIPNFRPLNPSVTTCIAGFVNTRYFDGCGGEEWRPSLTTCVDNNTFCTTNRLTLVPFQINCLQNSTSQLTVRVTGNNGNMVQFFNPATLVWEDATIGTSSHVFSLPSNGQTYQYYARLKGCTNTVQGSVTVCQPNAQQFSATRNLTVNCPTNCTQATILFSKTYYGSTQLIADSLAANDPLFATQATAYANENCACGAFNVDVVSVACSTSTPTPTPVALIPTPVAVGSVNYYQIRKCSDFSIYYTTTVLSFTDQSCTDAFNNQYVFTGTIQNSSSAPSGLLSGIVAGTLSGCGSQGVCTLSAVPVGAAYRITVRNNTQNPLVFCYQEQDSLSIISATIPVSTNAVVVCVNLYNYQDTTGLLSIFNGPECITTPVSQTCRAYTYDGGTNGGIINYTNCSGATAQINIAPGVVNDFCAQSGSYSAAVGITITEIGAC